MKLSERLRSPSQPIIWSHVKALTKPAVFSEQEITDMRDQAIAMEQELDERRQELADLETELAATKAALKKEEDEADVYAKRFNEAKVAVMFLYEHLVKAGVEFPKTVDAVDPMQVISDILKEVPKGRSIATAILPAR